jgi:hypothetical protein
MSESRSAKRCSSCGAVAEFPEGGVSTLCGYCDSPLVDADVARASVDLVAPFRIEQSVAEQKLKEHLAGRFWAPDAVRKGIVRDHRLRGVLVPFWAYTGVARSEYTARVGIWWYEVKTYRGSDGKMRTKRVRRTDWHHLSGTSIRSLDSHLVSASVGLEEEESNRLEPFDCGRGKPFDSRLVAGFEAELASIGRSDADKTAHEEVRGLESARVRSRLLPGDEGSVTTMDIDIELDKVELVLLPVWIATWRFGDKVGRQLVNGQTGRVVGDVPNSTAKIAIAIILFVGICFALVWGLG